MLALAPGAVTDEGARALAACPDARNLQTLDLSRNRLTEAGIAALQAAGINVIAAHQQEPYQGQYSDDYLYEGDIE